MSSGSTWVGYILGSTPVSAFLGEYHRAWNEQARVPCTLCAGRGLAACEVLHDVEAQPAEEAFAIAAARTGKQVLVDNSKLLDWTEKFLNRGNMDLRFVHVVKDPRGRIASARRRGSINLDDALASWCKENREFRNFVLASAWPNMTVSYDLLARAPRRQFKRLFRFCGLPFGEEALRYWNTEHHGFAANGASDALIRSAGLLGSAPSHFITGDDEFYERHSQRLFHDDRWRTELRREEQTAIQRNSEVRALLSSLGYRLTGTGVAPMRRWFSPNRWGRAA